MAKAKKESVEWGKRFEMMGGTMDDLIARINSLEKKLVEVTAELTSKSSRIDVEKLAIQAREFHIAIEIQVREYHIALQRWGQLFPKFTATNEIKLTTKEIEKRVWERVALDLAK